MPLFGLSLLSALFLLSCGGENIAENTGGATEVVASDSSYWGVLRPRLEQEATARIYRMDEEMKAAASIRLEQGDSVWSSPPLPAGDYLLEIFTLDSNRALFIELPEWTSRGREVAPQWISPSVRTKKPQQFDLLWSAGRWISLPPQTGKVWAAATYGRSTRITPALYPLAGRTPLSDDAVEAGALPLDGEFPSPTADLYALRIAPGGWLLTPERFGWGEEEVRWEMWVRIDPSEASSLPLFAFGSAELKHRSGDDWLLRSRSDSIVFTAAPGQWIRLNFENSRENGERIGINRGEWLPFESSGDSLLLFPGGGVVDAIGSKVWGTETGRFDFAQTPGSFALDRSAREQPLGLPPGALFEPGGIASSGRLDTVVVYVSHSHDDAEELLDGTIILDGRDLDMVTESSDSDLRRKAVGIRFTGVPLKKEDLILFAVIRMTSEDDLSSATNLFLSLATPSNSERFSNQAADITSREYYPATIEWNDIPPWEDNIQSEATVTPDLTSQLERLIRDPAWEPGGAAVWKIEGTGHRDAWSYDGNRSWAPRLEVIVIRDGWIAS